MRESADRADVNSKAADRSWSSAAYGSTYVRSLAKKTVVVREIIVSNNLRALIGLHVMHGIGITNKLTSVCEFL